MPMKFASALSVALGAAVGSASPCPPSKDWLSQKWDAIVVGAGTAGIIVADRLSEAGLKTLLLEQGGPSYGITGGVEKPGWLNGTGLSRVDVPGLFPDEYRPNSTIFAGHSSLLCPPHVVRAFQGCTVGGNSAINAGLYFQPPASDWDTYHPAGWHSADVAPAVARLLARQPPVTAYSSDGRFYAQSGYDAVADWIVGAAGFANVSFADEPDRKDRVFGRPVYDYIDGQRGGPVRTYLQSALARPNFRLQTGVRVERIEQAGGVASAVAVAVDAGNNGSVASSSVQLAPGGRVVLSAGALLSPQLLMYSGIGPRETLAKLAAAGTRSPLLHVNESSWVVQPAVGEGLFDNPNTFIELSAPAVASYAYDYGDALTPDRELFLSSRSGPYAFASQTSAFWAYVPHADGSRTGVQGTVSSAGYADFTANNTITLNVYGTSGVLSSGRVVLSDDGNFTAGPSDGIYYSHPRDAEAIAAFIHSIFQALPASSPESPAAEGLTPLNIARNATVDQIRDYITKPSAYAVGSVQHWSSSCRIDSCVDVNTKVIGSDNIHVIDASVLAPMTVNPQFAVMVAGELGAERLLKPRKA
ncbi:cellobiose dehydrogenase [Purpureocillium lavendulum]|uniref:Cellobiose dehydrogenase n=1 Tax=Purpureocillium lavendulum TaxID=1247861 RepID=A0AB34FVH3_9HYPO|nr:cellobiose dehydrogenase [Purpureocillium lavendulum]